MRTVRNAAYLSQWKKTKEKRDANSAESNLTMNSKELLEQTPYINESVNEVTVVEVDIELKSDAEQLKLKAARSYVNQRGNNVNLQHITFTDFSDRNLLIEPLSVGQRVTTGELHNCAKAIELDSRMKVKSISVEVMDTDLYKETSGSAVNTDGVEDDEVEKLDADYTDSTISTFIGGYKFANKEALIWKAYNDENGPKIISHTDSTVPDNATHVIELKENNELLTEEFAASEEEAWEIAKRHFNSDL